MKRALPFFLTLLMLFVITQASFVASGQETDHIDAYSDEAEDDAPVARVARLSFIEGDVSFLRAGVNEWASAVENLPLLAGDQIYTGRGARAEVQLGRGSYVRLSENTALTISALTDSAAQFEVTEGIAIIRVERLGSAFQQFELDTPNAALVLKQDGLYRVNVRGDDDSEVIVRLGEAEVSTADGSFKVREGHKLLVETSPGGRLEIALDTSRDNWDQWSYDRDTTIDSTFVRTSPDYVNTYETSYSDLYGVSDLSSYGSWISNNDYGYCWRPRVGSDWAPYRDGQWIWIPATGWTWLSNEPWGWAPYHYGRWVFVSGFGWTWVPGFTRLYESQRRPWFLANLRSYYRWRPALVYFFDCPTSSGHYVGWYPLRPGERWHRPERNWRGGDHAHLQYPAPGNGAHRPDRGGIGIRLPRERTGISLLPVEGFNRTDRYRVRPIAPGREIAGSLDRVARPGLPELSINPVAARPRLRDEDGQRPARRAVVPPSEVINRPVVIRNRPADSTVGNSAPRERRLIIPRRPEVNGEASSRRERRRNSEDGAGAGESNGEAAPRIRVPRTSPAEAATGAESEPRRRRERPNDSAGQRPSEGAEQSGSNDSSGEHRRKQRVSVPAPVPKQNPSADSQNNDEERARRHHRDESQSREEARPRDRENNHGEERQRARERNDQSQAPRASEPRQERPQQSTERRSESREERRQERREEREQRKRPD